MDEKEVEEFIGAIDLTFYMDFDPFFHFITFERLRESNPPKIRVRDDLTDKIISHSVITRIENSRENASKNVIALGRVFRYFSSEMLILLILSSGHFGPFLRVVSKYRNDQLNNIFISISNKEVPEKFKISIKNEELNFDEWLAFNMFEDVNFSKDERYSEIVNMVVEEAKLIASRGAINAFKHGKPLSAGESPEVTMTNNALGESVSNIRLNGFNWVEWHEKKNGAINIKQCSEEVKPDEDNQRLLETALLMDAIKEFRLAKIKKKESIKLTLPAKMKMGLMVRRQVVTLSFNPVADAKL